ncbi:DUF4097 family beta strand repeat-containing protein [Actinokineospora pegani]|uniref:DUF4097 family beta strand repeat-containing protein n=1 Tax=Actinokineospora pegani TaxID=2654637 RepID=UPI0012EA9E51|nr:DUF4097 family beta strand repeat-containing protein [Actinokineospora pegani]
MKNLLVAVLIGASGAALVSGCGMLEKQGAYSDDARFDQVVREVRLSVDSGSVRIVAGETSSVHRTVHYRGDRPDVSTFRMEGDTLVLDSCEVSGCWVDYDVVVPRGVAVDGDIDSGQAEVQDASTVSLAVSSGDLTVTRPSGAVSVEADSGRVTLAETQDAVTVRADSSDVEVRAAKAAPLVARVDSGTIDVRVPRGDYNTTLRVDSGRIDNRIGHDPTGTPLEARANSGTITLDFG